MIYEKKKKIVSFMSSNQKEKRIVCYVICYTPVNLSKSSIEVDNHHTYICFTSYKCVIRQGKHKKYYPFPGTQVL